MSGFDWAPLFVAVQILRHRNVPMCVFEIIVPQHQWIAAAVLICSTGLFLPTRPWEHPPGSNFDQGWRIRNKFAHLSTPGWTMSPSSVAIVPDVRAGICLDIPETCWKMASLSDQSSHIGEGRVMSHDPDDSGNEATIPSSLQHA
ncbi:hypothetical protein OCS_06110 [Ophiocordyceps sinensis CO18]|uniref:Uncharacterized protein n=1 Tax=Ophiocordyceps sinensis (strain Co18 / CGMCC 3.14243) TaxID=911162 RepID=T5A8Q7_OPHSC|nr:hypothetical protein OCS_06110 [Ophiocordyceps sinensis CO18]